jgi:single-strand DNA-binding protein
VNEIYVTVSGNVVAEPESRTTKSGGVPFAAFRLASTVRRVNFKTGEFEDAATNYVNVTAFRALGANIANSVHKGDPVIVHGRMRVNQWARQDGTTGTSVEIDAYNVGHDLTRGTTEFTKVSRAQMDQSDRMADPAVQAVHASGEGLDPENDDYDVEGLDLGDGSAGAPSGHQSEEALATL